MAGMSFGSTLGNMATGETFVGRYIDTVQDKYGLVWHLIEE